jgi:hypothetical protein
MAVVVVTLSVSVTHVATCPCRSRVVRQSSRYSVTGCLAGCRRQRSNRRDCCADRYKQQAPTPDSGTEAAVSWSFSGRAQRPPSVLVKQHR